MITFRRLGLSLAASALAAPAFLFVATIPAEAATGTYFSSCAKLNKVYKYGVAKNAAAARYQVRQGNGRPAYGAKAAATYFKNKSRLDRDKDGTACERR